jgi:hypothetical protein
MVTVIGYTSTRFGTTFAFFTTAKIAAFAASNSWPPPSQFLLYVTVNFISPSEEEADTVVLFKEVPSVLRVVGCCLDRCKNKNLLRAVSVLLASVKLRICLFSLSLTLKRGVARESFCLNNEEKRERKVARKRHQKQENDIK